MHHVHGVTGKAFYVLDIYHESVGVNFHYKTQPFIIKIRSASGASSPAEPLSSGFALDPTGGGQSPQTSHYSLVLCAHHKAPWIRQ